MERKPGGTLVLGVLLLLALSLLLRRALPVIAGFLKIVIIISFILLFIFFFMLIRSALKGGEGPKTGVDTSVKKKNKGAQASPEEAAKLKAANQEVLAARLAMAKIKDKDVRGLIEPCLANSDKILKTLKEQPDEIRRSSQFLNYYLPTLNVVLDKYIKVEESGINLDATKEKVTSYLSDIAKATEREYDNLFSNEVLDLSVEMEAMQMAFQRDGLIDEADIPKDPTKDINLTI